jgi:hypothetical protein
MVWSETVRDGQRNGVYFSIFCQLRRATALRSRYIGCILGDILDPLTGRQKPYVAPELPELRRGPTAAEPRVRTDRGPAVCPDDGQRNGVYFTIL